MVCSERKSFSNSILSYWLCQESYRKRPENIGAGNETNFNLLRSFENPTRSDHCVLCLNVKIINIFLLRDLGKFVILRHMIEIL